MRFRPSTAAVLVLLTLAVVVLCALGTWQVYRLLESREADALREARVAATPLDWAAARALPNEEVTYRIVRVAGRWDHAHTMLIANRDQYFTLGREAVTPLLPEGGGPAILVNRGWFPDGRQGEVLAALATEPGATVEGLARYVGDELLPGRQLPSGQWTRLDPAVMGRELPYEVVPWQLTQGRREIPGDERQPPTVFPVQRYRVGGFTPPHLDYIITWYGLAIALVATAVIRLRKRAAPPPA